MRAAFLENTPGELPEWLSRAYMGALILAAILYAIYLIAR